MPASLSFWLSMRAICLSLALIALPTSASVSAPLEVRYHRSDIDAIRFNYYYELLDMALKATVGSHGPYVMKAYDEKMTPERLNWEAVQGRIINVHWSDVGHPDLDQGMLRVPMALDRGLLGQRVLLIRAEDREKFKAITSLDQLRKLSIGQGRDWGDIKVLRYNGFNVVEGSRYPVLFDMLVAKRFDAFGRGVNEAPQEHAAFSAPNPTVEIEQTILLVYPLPVFFYVSNNTPALAQRLLVGLQRIVRDGSWDALFDRCYGASVASLHLQRRKVFRLQNPFLPPDLPPDAGRLPAPR